MDRRGFLKTILAAGIAPAVVKYSSIMPVRPIYPKGYGFSQSDWIITKNYFIVSDPDQKIFTKAFIDDNHNQMDFEQGTFTPTIAGSSGLPTQSQYQISEGFYTRIGNTVTIHGRAKIA